MTLPLNARILITGWPRAGKSTVAAGFGAQMGIVPRSTDSLISTHSWSEASEAISFWFDEPGPWIIEGVAIPRALRKWHIRNPAEPPPFDKLIILVQKSHDLKPGQISMGHGVDTVLRELTEWFADTSCSISHNA